jgi:hypothetical protein
VKENSIEQAALIQNWNEIRKIVKKRSDGKLDLPELNPKEGTCKGLSYAFIDYHQRGQGNQFFGLLNKLANPSNIENTVDSILKNDKNSKAIIDFIYKMHYLQRNQLKDRLDKESDATITHLADNIGCKNVARPLVYYNQADDLKDVLNSLRPNDGMEMTFHKHSIAVYKTSGNTWIVYDSNNTKKYDCRSLDEASNMIFNSVENIQLHGKLFSMDSLIQIGKDILSSFKLTTKTLVSPTILNVDIIERQSLQSLETPRAELSTNTTTKKIVDQVKSSKKFSNTHDTLSIMTDLIKRNNTKQLSEFLDLYKPNLRDPKIARELPSLVVWIEDPNIIDVLITHGAYVNSPLLYSDGATSFLHVAVENGKTEIAERLLQHHGANPNLFCKTQTEPYPITPLHKAIMNDDLNAVRLLLRSGANPNIDDARTYYTPLQLAIFKRTLNNQSIREEIIKELTTWPKIGDSQQSALGIDQSDAVNLTNTLSENENAGTLQYN